MKIARATPEDINALCDLAFAVDAINAGSIPPAEGGEDSEWEHIGAGNLLNILHDDTPASLQKESLDICRRCLIRLLEIAESGHITRAAGNLEAVFLPSNHIIDLEADTLETHPSIDQGWADTARLDWLADPGNTIGNVMLPGWYSGEYDSLRDALDAAMNTPGPMRRNPGKSRTGRLFSIFEEIFKDKEKAAAGEDVTRSLITGQPINKEQP